MKYSITLMARAELRSQLDWYRPLPFSGTLSVWPAITILLVFSFFSESESKSSDCRVVAVISALPDVNRILLAKVIWSPSDSKRTSVWSFRPEEANSCDSWSLIFCNCWFSSWVRTEASCACASVDVGAFFPVLVSPISITDPITEELLWWLERMVPNSLLISWNFSSSTFAIANMTMNKASSKVNISE